MLEIVVNGISLDLPENVSVRMEYNNPLFSETEIEGSRSLPFNFDKTPKNERALNWVNRPEVVTSFDAEYTTVVKFSGNVIMEATLKVKEVNESFSCYLQVGISSFSVQVKDKTLRDIDYSPENAVLPDYFDFATVTLGSATAIDDTNAIFKNELDPATSQFPQYWPVWVVLPIKRTGIDEPRYEYNGFYYHASAPREYFHYFDPGGIGDSYDLSFPMPCPSIYYVLKRGFKYFGFDLKGTFFNDDEMKRVMLYGFNYLDFMHTDPAAQDIMAGFTDKINNGNQVSDELFSTFINHVSRTFCVAVFIDDLRHEVEIVPRKDMLADNTIIDWTSKASAGYGNKPSPYKGYKFSYIEDDDDGLTDEYFKSLDKLRILDPVADDAALQATVAKAGDVRLVQDVQEYWIAEGSEISITWVFHSQNYHGITVGEGKTKIESALMPIFMLRDEDEILTKYHAISRKWLIPYIGKFGIHMEAGSPAESSAWRTFFYRGLHNDSNGNSYPLGTTDIYDYSGNVVGTKNLRWDTDNGLYINYWKKWVEFMQQAKLIVREIRLDIKDLINMPTIYKRKIRIDYVTYFLGRAKVTLRKYKMEAAECEFYKV